MTEPCYSKVLSFPVRRNLAIARFCHFRCFGVVAFVRWLLRVGGSTCRVRAGCLRLSYGSHAIIIYIHRINHTLVRQYNSHIVGGVCTDSHIRGCSYTYTFVCSFNDNGIPVYKSRTTLFICCCMGTVPGSIRDSGKSYLSAFNRFQEHVESNAKSCDTC